MHSQFLKLTLLESNLAGIPAKLANKICAAGPRGPKTELGKHDSTYENFVQALVYWRAKCIEHRFATMALSKAAAERNFKDWGLAIFGPLGPTAVHGGPR